MRHMQVLKFWCNYILMFTRDEPRIIRVRQVVNRFIYARQNFQKIIKIRTFEAFSFNNFSIFSFPEHTHLIYLKIFRTPLKFEFGCQTLQFNVSTPVMRASSKLWIAKTQAAFFHYGWFSHKVEGIVFLQNTDDRQ